jgi:hypothetical protein
MVKTFLKILALSYVLIGIYLGFAYGLILYQECREMGNGKAHCFQEATG